MSDEKLYDISDLNPKIQKLHEKFVKDLELNEVNLHDKMLLRPSLVAEWSGIYYAAIEKKKKMAKALDEMREACMLKKYEQKKGMGYLNETTLKLEVEKELRGNSQYQQFKEEVSEQDEVIAYITSCRQAIKDFGYDIRNAIDGLNLER